MIVMDYISDWLVLAAACLYGYMVARLAMRHELEQFFNDDDQYWSNDDED